MFIGRKVHPHTLLVCQHQQQSVCVNDCVLTQWGSWILNAATHKGYQHDVMDHTGTCTLQINQIIKWLSIYP